MLPTHVNKDNEAIVPRRPGHMSRLVDRIRQYGWNYLGLYYFIQIGHELNVIDRQRRNALYALLATSSAGFAAVVTNTAYNIEEYSRRELYRAGQWLYNTLVPYEESRLTVIEDQVYFIDDNQRLQLLGRPGKSFTNLLCQAKAINAAARN
jgi:hypothetical protein